MADQLYGTDGAGEGLDAASLRADATRYMEANEGDFAPFVEDDEAIGDYLRRMRQAGCWGGNMELTSLSRCHQLEIHIYQPGEVKPWIIGDGNGSADDDTDDVSVRIAKLLYVNGDHYQSLRELDDDGGGPARHKETAEADEAYAAVVSEVAERGCVWERTAAAALVECGGDVEAAVDYVRALGDGADEALAAEFREGARATITRDGEAVALGAAVDALRI